jgi:hypothetical protein
MFVLLFTLYSEYNLLKNHLIVVWKCSFAAPSVSEYDRKVVQQNNVVQNISGEIFRPINLPIPPPFFLQWLPWLGYL